MLKEINDISEKSLSELKIMFPVVVHTFSDGHKMKLLPDFNFKKYPYYNGKNGEVSATLYISSGDGKPYEYFFGYGYKECREALDCEIYFDSIGKRETEKRYDRKENLETVKNA